MHTPTHTRSHTHTDKHVNLLLFDDDSGFVNAPECYVIRTLPVLFPLKGINRLVCIINKDPALCEVGAVAFRQKFCDTCESVERNA